MVFSGVSAQGTMIVANDPYNLRQRATTYTTDDNGPYTVGTNYFGDGSIQDETNFLIPFDLTGIGTITDATFFSQANFAYPIISNIDLYGIGYSVDVTTFPDTTANMFYVGASDGSATSIQFDYMSDPVAIDSYTGSSGAAEAALISYLNARPFGSDVVWFRLNADASVPYVGPTGNEFYYVRFDPSGAPGKPPWDGLNDGVPYLDITAVPEPGISVLLGLGLFGVLFGYRRRRA